MSGTETGSESENENGTVCSERGRASGSETWSGTWSETWTWRGIWRRACPLPMTSSPGCGWRTGSGSWSGCGSWSDSLSASSCGNGSGSCCDCWEDRETGGLRFMKLHTHTKQLMSSSLTHLLLSSKIFSLRPFNSVPSSLAIAFFMSLRDANSTTLCEATFIRTKL